MQIVVNALLSKIREHNPELNEAQLKTRRYGLEVCVNELVKMLIYLTVFTIFSLGGYFLLSMFIYSTIRILTGGYHAGSFWGCFVISFIGFAAVILGGQYIELLWFEKAVLLLISLSITLIYAPVFHKNTPRKNLAKKGKYKLISVLLVTFWSGLACLLPGVWSTTAIFSIFLEAVMQPLGKKLNPV